MKREKHIYFIFIIVVLCMVILILNYKREPASKKVAHTIRWSYKEGETVQLDLADLLYDNEGILVSPTSVDKENAFYELPKGVYYFTDNDELINKKIEIAVEVK